MIFEAIIKKNDYHYGKIFIINMLSVEILANHCIDACLNTDDTCNDDEVDDYIHMIVDTYVSHNSIEDNTKIIMDNFKSIYKAIKSYENEYEEFSYRDEAHFHALLAYSIINSQVRDEVYGRLQL